MSKFVESKIVSDPQGWQLLLCQKHAKEFSSAIKAFDPHPKIFCNAALCCEYFTHFAYLIVEPEAKNE